MKITHQLLELYNAGVNAGLDLKLNLRTSDGDEFFSFSRLPGSKHQRTRTRSRRWRSYGRARNTSKDVRSPLQAAGPSQVRERSHLQVARPRQVDESSQPQVAGPPKVREKSQPQVAGPRQVGESSQPQVAGPRQVDERSQPQVAGPPKVRDRSQPQVAGPRQVDDESQLQKSESPQENERNPALTVKTPLMEERICRKGLRRHCNDKHDPNPLFLKEPFTSFTPSSYIPQLDGENEPDPEPNPEPDPEPDPEPEQKGDPKPEQTVKPLIKTIPPELEPAPGLNPPSNIVNPMFGFCQDTTCLICPDKTMEKIGNYDACFPSTDKSIPGCERVHWHSKNTLCFTAGEFKKKTNMW